jgi:hypothetical protein
MRPGERPAGTELEEVVERLGVVAPGVARWDRVEDHFPKRGLGRGEGQGLLFPAWTGQNEVCRFQNYLAYVSAISGVTIPETALIAFGGA